MFKLLNIRYLFTCLILIFILLSIGFIWFNYNIFSYIKNAQINDNIDDNWGVVALTGGRNRIAQAVEIYEKNNNGFMLISGVKKGTTLDMILKRDDITIKVNKKIDLGYNAVDTVGNAKEIREWSDKNNIDNIYVVTSFYHIPRSKLEIERCVKGKNIVYIASPSDFVKKEWWSNFNSFEFLMKEYVKFLIVFVQYKVLGL